MPLLNPTPPSARTADSDALLLVGIIGLKKLRVAVGPTSKMRKDTLRSLRDKPRFSRRILAPLSDRVVLLLGPEMGCNEIRKFVLDNLENRRQGSGIRSQESEARSQAGIVSSPRSSPDLPDLLPQVSSRRC